MADEIVGVQLGGPDVVNHRRRAILSVAPLKSDGQPVPPPYAWSTDDENVATVMPIGDGTRAFVDFTGLADVVNIRCHFGGGLDDTVFAIQVNELATSSGNGALALQPTDN